VRGDRIVGVGPIASRGAAELDATGLAVSPGYIDVHTHDDFAVLLDPAMAFKVMQGVTTDIVGNCGSGVVPFQAGLQRFSRFTPGAAPPRWESFATYLARVQEAGPSLNVATLIGHGTLRTGAMGNEQRAPSPAELDQMRAWVREGVEAGAVGLSTGLIYEPGRYARADEVVELGPDGGLHYARDERVLDLPAAIHKMTGMPAAKFRLADRGVLRAGAFADLVVFDPARIRDAATYEDPRRFRAVYVNGTAVARDGAHTGARPGRALRRR